MPTHKTMVGAVSLALFLLGFAAAQDGPQKHDVNSSELMQKLEEVSTQFRKFQEERAAEMAKLQEQRVQDMAAIKALLAENSLLRDGPEKLRFSRDRFTKSRNRRLEDASSINGKDIEVALDTMWLLLCGALVMFMQAGFALVEAGACRIKNVQNILMKNLTDVCVGTISWWSFGWMFAYGGAGEAGTRFAGYENYFGHDFHLEPQEGLIVENDGMMPLNWFFQWAFCSAAATIVSGGIAERVNFGGYLVYTVWMTTIIYPIVVSWTWTSNGWLTGGDTDRVNEIGYKDFAGSGIVHMCGGVGALMGAVIVGPRTGRWDPAKATDFDPHSLPLIVLGTFVLWFGWYGFNCGSTLGMKTKGDGQLAAAVAMNTTISAASGGLALLGVRFLMFRKYDIGGMCNGILAGLVSITAPCSNVESGSAMVIGLIGALVYQAASSVLKAAKVDDPIDAFAVHGACGAWGTLAVAIFDWGDGIGIYHGSGFECFKDSSGACIDDARAKGFLANFVGVITIAAWSAILSTIVLLPMKLGGVLRANDDVQESGLDTAKHSPSKAYTMGEGSGVTGTV